MSLKCKIGIHTFICVDPDYWPFGLNRCLRCGIGEAPDVFKIKVFSADQMKHLKSDYLTECARIASGNGE